MTTIHLILNAHLDPIWLWPWQDGLDQALATCRSACDRLDAHPDIVFTRGEAWVYQQVEKVDPALFERIREHVKAGRWSIVGGWWIQPDCNQPSGFGFERQIETGKRYFVDRFGQFPRVAYNVDSFGHNASLPALMRSAGQDCYVMMRPQPHEMELPSRVFRWRGYDKGPEVVVFRIAGSYNTGRTFDEHHVKRALDALPEGLEHTMCFVGLGDHGGGPTEEQIHWLKEHQDTIEGCRLVFSSPERFFDAISADLHRLPLVVGELQHHAIGCYSVHRGVKTSLRRAEHLLRSAEIATAGEPGGQETDKLRVAWEKVCFNQFHDTLGGTCIPSSYVQIADQIGLAAAVADETIHLSLRRKMSRLGSDPLQRIILYNPSDVSYEGYASFEPWLEFGKWGPESRLLDEDGCTIPFQLVDPEAVVQFMGALTFPIRVEPGNVRTLRIRIDPSSPASSIPSPSVTASSEKIISNSGSAVSFPDAKIQFGSGMSLPFPRIDLIKDDTDTWSHGIDRYPEDLLQSAAWGHPTVVDSGPLMASALQTGQIGESRLCAEWRVYGGEQYVELRLRVEWREEHKILKMTLPMPSALEASRSDGIPGGELERPNSGKECPLRDRTLLRLCEPACAQYSGAETFVGVVCPSVYAIDAAPERVRLTLLRSPLLAHHDPQPAVWARPLFADRGDHEFRFRFFAGKDLTGKLLDWHALMMQRPIVTASLTLGMPGKKQG